MNSLKKAGEKIEMQKQSNTKLGHRYLTSQDMDRLLAILEDLHKSIEEIKEAYETRHRICPHNVRYGDE